MTYCTVWRIVWRWMEQRWRHHPVWPPESGPLLTPAAPDWSSPTTHDINSTAQHRVTFMEKTLQEEYKGLNLKKMKHLLRSELLLSLGHESLSGCAGAQFASCGRDGGSRSGLSRWIFLLFVPLLLLGHPLRSVC